MNNDGVALLVTRPRTVLYFLASERVSREYVHGALAARPRVALGRTNLRAVSGVS